MDEHDIELCDHLGGDINGKSPEELEKELTRVLKEHIIARSGPREDLDVMGASALKLAFMKLAMGTSGKAETIPGSVDLKIDVAESPSLVDSPSSKVLRLKQIPPAGAISPVPGIVSSTKDEELEGATAETVVTFKTFRSNEKERYPMDSSLSEVVHIEERTTPGRQEDTEESLIRSILRQRRLKSLAEAQLESLRVQENLMFARENGIDEKAMHNLQADIEIACTDLDGTYYHVSGPLMPILKGCRLKRREIEWIRKIEEIGWTPILQEMEDKLEESQKAKAIAERDYSKVKRALEAQNEGKKKSQLKHLFVINGGENLDGSTASKVLHQRINTKTEIMQLVKANDELEGLPPSVFSSAPYRPRKH